MKTNQAGNTAAVARVQSTRPAVSWVSQNARSAASDSNRGICRLRFNFAIDLPLPTAPKASIP